jgi:hypothetical protein
MNEIEKCRIRLAHWKDHNIDHVKGYEEVARIIEELGVAKAPEMIRRGICFVEAANVEFEKALKALGTPDSTEGESPAVPQADTSHTHCHGHHHEHSHQHEPSDHHHEHSHEHGQCDHHDHHHTHGSVAHRPGHDDPSD